MEKLKGIRLSAKPYAEQPFINRALVYLRLEFALPRVLFITSESCLRFWQCRNRVTFRALAAPILGVLGGSAPTF